MSILVLAEHNNVDIKSSTLNTISAAAQIDQEIDVLVAGYQCEELANKISKCEKVSKVFFVDNEKLEKIHSELIQYSRSKWNEGCDIVIMGHYHHSFNFKENNNELIILDDCCDQQFNYAKYDGNSISIESF